MNIEYRTEKKYTEVGVLKYGQCFIYKDELFMKIQNDHISESIDKNYIVVAVSLTNNCLNFFREYDVVQVVEVKAQVIE